MSYGDRVDRLLSQLRELPDVLVAFSGGVDSGVLLHAAHSVTRAIAVTADSPSLPRRELAECETFAASLACEWRVVATEELADPRYRANVGDRCYYCKHALFERMEAEARALGVAALAYGQITDDLSDDRPGERAAREFAVLAPLCRAGLSKADVRRYAREHGLALADKPASACLASRIPVGTAVTRDALGVVERAEDALRGLGFRELRVRHHGERARVELGPDDLAQGRRRAHEVREVVSRCGFREVEVVPYRRGGAVVSAGRSEAAPRGG